MTTSPTLRDRIARAIYASDWPNGRWEMRPTEDHERYLDNADAVLAVLPATIRHEGHRFALSTTLGLGTGAPWDAIHEQVAELRRRADETAAGTEVHVCKPGASVYYCPTSGETESGCHGGFDVCCDRPDLHQPTDEACQQLAASSTRATPEHVKHSGPDAEFCVLCLSGEHERVDEQPAAIEATDTGPLLFWNEAAGVTYQDGRITLHVDQAVNLAQTVPAGSLILQPAAAETLRKALTRALAGAHAPQCPHCGESLADYDTDTYVYRAGDERPYCSSECVVAAYRAARARQDGS